MITLVTVIFLIVTFLMIISILMQSSKNDGMGAGFGALGGTNVFGGRGPADFLKKFTGYAAIVFGALVIALAVLNRSSSSVEENALINNAKQQTGTQQTAPATDLFQSAPTDSTKK